MKIISIRKIGTTPAYKRRRKSLQQIQTDSGPSQLHSRTTITQFDITESVKIIDGGYVIIELV